MQYRHVFFDLDHTIWDFETNAREAMELLFTDLALEQKLGVTFPKFHQAYIHHNHIMWDRYQKGFISREDLKWKRMWRTLLDFKLADEALARRMAEGFLEILPTRKNLFPYTLEILDYLQQKGYELHLITNGFEKTQHSKIQNAAIHHYFRHVITSEASNSMKPQKEIFEFALQLAGCTHSEAIMVGDNLDADVAGALNAGLHAVYVDHLGVDAGDVVPTFTIRHLQELETIL